MLGVNREGVKGGLAKLYTGLVPEGDDQLSPGSGLTLVRINDYAGTEGVRSVALSPDGSKMAALVGLNGEVRVYDFGADKLYVYDQGEDGKVKVSHDLPPAATSLGQDRTPALAHNGIMRMQWSPDANRLALTRYESVGIAGLWVVDVATGDATLVRTFSNTTVPHVAWSGDGKSVFALTTRLFQGNGLSDSEVRRINAVEDGKDMGDRWSLKQVAGYRTLPADFTAYGDESDPGPYPVPPTAPIEGEPSGSTICSGGGDCHVLVIDRDNNRLYEMGNASRLANNSWNASGGAIFHLDSNNVRPTVQPGWTSADAAGAAAHPNGGTFGTVEDIDGDGGLRELAELDLRGDVDIHLVAGGASE